MRVLLANLTPGVIYSNTGKPKQKMQVYKYRNFPADATKLIGELIKQKRVGTMI